MATLSEILKNVRTMKSIIGEAKSVTPDIVSILNSLGIGTKPSMGNMASFIANVVNSPYLELGVRKDDPEKLIDEIYRLKAKYYHPDSKTGNKNKFIRLKWAYDKIKKK